MKWEKKGLIFKPDKSVEWMTAYAANPVAYHLGGNLYRVYFAGRNDENKSSVGYFEIDITKPTEVLKISDKPVLSPGELGYFDCDGVYAASILSFEDKLYMYYIAWNRGIPEPMFRASIGLAISEDNGRSFQKYSDAPILDRCNIDPLFVSSPTVVKIEEGLIMYYISGTKWYKSGGGYYSNYLLKEAYSKDGKNWERNNDIAIGFEHPYEEHIARMSVIKTNTGYEGWYSYECGNGYRIGMAKSGDGKNWKRFDGEAGMELSSVGWDSEAQAYPFVFLHNNRRYMLYNGNRNGYDGVGLAVQVD